MNTIHFPVPLIYEMHQSNVPDSAGPSGFALAPLVIVAQTSWQGWWQTVFFDFCHFGFQNDHERFLIWFPHSIL